ncbi:YybH family protein [Paractinoplanes globisporus]|uniref:YybH family protein n=1 Tax=Paractinoplanes globisporus TaxID=113565 RepID=A0ABW6WXI6_9ACTN|nr:SgcJ/EcaC family oxidoreductase [Actinoplanes globisporus]
MFIDTPAAVHAALEDAFRSGDLEAYLALHEDDATVVVPPEGRAVRGKPAIRDAMTGLLDRPQGLTSVVRKTLEAGDLALTRATWTIEGTAPDGTPLRLGGNGTVLSRRRPDGQWGIVLDDPLGPA